MKTKQELIEARAAKVAQMDKLVKDGQGELRTMTDEEKTDFENLEKEVRDIDKDLERIRSLENIKGATPIVAPAIIKKEEGKFSLLRSIRNMVEGRNQHDADAVVLDMGKSDSRDAGISSQVGITIPLVDHRHEQRADILAGTATQGAEVVATDVLNLVGPLRNALVFSRFGATYLTGLVGDVDIPRYAGSTAAWKGEVAAAADAAGAFDELSLSPLRITGLLDISRRFLVQDSANAEALLRADLVAAVAQVLESTALSDAAASAGVSPAGLLAGTPTFTGGVMTFAEAVSLETAIDNANAATSNLAYITTPSVRGLLKSTAKVASTDSVMIMNDNTLNGYPVATTVNMDVTMGTGAEHGIAFANWSHLIIGQWGGVDLIVDPYSLASTAQVRITVNSYWDYVYRHDDALAFGETALS